MNIRMNGPTLRLDDRHTLALTDALGTVASLKSGCLWITMEHDRRDIVLLPGESWTIDRNGRTLIHAEQRSEVALVEPLPQPGRIERWRALAKALCGWLSRPLPVRALPYY